MGCSGQRFYSVLQYLSKSTGEYSIAGICDTNLQALVNFDVEIPRFTSITEAKKSQFDVIIVCTNETAHYEILTQVVLLNPKFIVCEKPLTSTLGEAKMLQESIPDTRICVNLIERYSPILCDYKDWQLQNSEFTPRRIEFFWGKNRINDHRPTMGVLSEIIHPLDLIQAIYNPQSMIIESALGTQSNYSIHEDGKFEAVDVILYTENYPIIGHSSFAWPVRDRRLVVNLGSKDSMRRVEFYFDNPKWDCDLLKIFDITQGPYAETLLLESRYTNSDFPPEILERNKLAIFLKACIDSESYNSRIVEFAEALRLQVLLDGIEQKLISNQLVNFNL